MANFNIGDYTVQGRSRKSVWLGDKKTGRRVQLLGGKTVQLSKEEAELLGPGVAVPNVEQGGPATAVVNTPSGNPAKPPVIDDPYDTDMYDGGTVDDDWVDFLKGSVKDISEQLADYDDVAELKNILATEASDKNRAGVTSAVKARIKALNEK